MTTRTAGRAALLTLATALALTASACSKESDRARDRTGAGSEPSAAATTVTTDGSGTAAYPDFAPPSYTYRLEVICFCPQVGPVEIAVEEGKVVRAERVDPAASGKGGTTGTAAPGYTRLTINDIIAKANDPEVAEVEVDWPDGQDHPSSVMIDRIAQAVDDEVTYAIKDVRVD